MPSNGLATVNPLWSKKKLAGNKGGKSLGRYPFISCVNKYLDQVGQSYALPTLKELDRRYRRMDIDLRMLEREGKVSSTNPLKMTPEDILSYVSFLKTKGMKESGICHDLGPLDNLLAFNGNSAVKTFKIKYRSAVPRKRVPRYPALDERSFSKILECSKRIKDSDWGRLKAYALVLLSICAGLRNKEIRTSKISDIDTFEWVITPSHVKGEGTYGQSRSIAIRPEAKEILIRYLKQRNKLVSEICPGNQALFPAFRGNGDGYLSSNTLQKMKRIVEKETGLKFNLRTCRRTFGQLAIDQGSDLETVSVLMGHNTTKTTEQYYCRKRQETAIREAHDRWKSVMSNSDVNHPEIEQKYGVTGYA